MTNCPACGHALSAGDRFCGECGAATGSPAAAPATPPPPSRAYTKFCAACGNGLIATAAICPACGTLVSSPGRTGESRNKTVAVLLAVFLSGWTWLYLYKHCATKFWIFLATYVASFGIAIAIFFTVFNSIVTQCGSDNPPECQPHFPPGFFGFFVIALLQLGVQVWAIIDVSTKSQSWYDHYDA